MSGSSKKEAFKMRTFLTGLRQTMSALPSEAEKQEIDASCTALLEFLTDLQRKLGSVPSTETMQGVQQTVQRLEVFLTKAETNLALAAVFGLRRPLAAKRRSAAVTEEEKGKAKTALADLDSLPIDKIRLKLSNELSYSMRELRAIASDMGIGSTKNLDRVGLVHRITTKIANYRGYQSLSGSAAQTSIKPKPNQGRVPDSRGQE